MKFTACFVVLCLCLYAQADTFYYSPPKAPCIWGVGIEKIGYNVHTREEKYVYGAYQKNVTRDHNGDITSVSLYRPDVLGTGHFDYDGYSCTIKSVSQYIPSYASVLGINGYVSFNHIREGEFKGKKCWVYYNNINISAVYVDSNGFLIGVIDHANDTRKRIEVSIDYYSSASVKMSDFSFSHSYIYRCPDERVFDTPSAFFSKCAASTTTAILSIVIAGIISVIAIVF